MKQSVSRIFVSASLAVMAFFALSSSSNAYAFDDSPILIGNTSYTLRAIGTTITFASLDIAELYNQTPSSSPFLRVELWLGKKCYDPYARKQSAYVLLGQNLNDYLDPYSSLVRIRLSKRLRMRPARGTYRVSLGVMNSARTQVYNSICFNRKIRVQ